MQERINFYNYVWEKLAEARKFMAKGFYSAAIDTYEEILLFTDSKMEASVNITYCYLDMHCFELALEYAEAMYKYEKSNEFVVVNYTSVLIELNRLEEVINILENQINEGACNYAVYTNLGLAFSLNKNYSKAVTCFNQSIDLATSNPYKHNRCHLKHFNLKREKLVEEIKKASDNGCKFAKELLKNRAAADTLGFQV